MLPSRSAAQEGWQGAVHLDCLGCAGARCPRRRWPRSTSGPAPLLDRVEKGGTTLTVRFITHPARPTPDRPDFALRFGNLSEQGYRPRRKLAGPRPEAHRHRPLPSLVRFQDDNILELEHMTNTGVARRRSRKLTFVVVPEVASRVNGLLSGRIRLHHRDVPTGPDRPDRARERRASTSWAGPITNHRPDGVRQEQRRHARTRWCVRAHSPMPSRQDIVDALWGGRTEVARGPSVVLLRRHVRRGLGSFPGNTTRSWPSSWWKRPAYNGEPITDAVVFFLLNNYYTNPGLHRADQRREPAPDRSQTSISDEGELAADQRSQRLASAAHFPTGRTTRPPRPGLLDRESSNCQNGGHSSSANGPTRSLTRTA